MSSSSRRFITRCRLYFPTLRKHVGAIIDLSASNSAVPDRRGGDIGLALGHRRPLSFLPTPFRHPCEYPKDDFLSFPHLPFRLFKLGFARYRQRERSSGWDSV